MSRETTATVEEEAIAWFVRTHSDQHTLGDEDRFAQWLKQDSSHAEAYTRVEKEWRSRAGHHGSPPCRRETIGQKQALLGAVAHESGPPPLSSPAPLGESHGFPHLLRCLREKLP